MSADDVWYDEGGPVVEPDDEPEQESETTVCVKLHPSFVGQYKDLESGLRFRKGNCHNVSESEAERLLNTRFRGNPVFVRTDS